MIADDVDRASERGNLLHRDELRVTSRPWAGVVNGIDR
jgi:hypothetical protein